MKFILMDIEGTTSSISFVHQTLFPYAKKRITEFLKNHSEELEVKNALNEVRITLQEEGQENENLSVEDYASVLLMFMEEDRKHGALKKIQGLIWKGGFESGEIQGHIYSEVSEKLKSWKAAGLELGIYSSGSVQAQKLLFSHSLDGDLTPLLSSFFDTKIGHKREVESYKNILKELKLEGPEVTFLSDVVEELDAAKMAGIRTFQLVRPEHELGIGEHQIVHDFSELPF